jgi:hypothetical protein
VSPPASSRLSTLSAPSVARPSGPYGQCTLAVPAVGVPTVGPSVRPPLHPSFVVQLDGLLYSIFRLRVEVDVFAPSATSSFCMSWGKQCSPASAFCGLYFSERSLLLGCVESVSSQQGFGVFLLPSPPLYPPELLSRLQAASKLHFSFVCGHIPWSAYFCSWGSPVLRRKRNESEFALSVVQSAPVRVGLLPFCPARVSPLAVRPDGSADSVVASPSMPTSSLLSSPPLKRGSWDSDAFRQFARCFPFPDTAALAILAASFNGLPTRFAGDRSKCVLRPNMASSPEDLIRYRSRFSEEVSAGRMIGPFSSLPFPNEWCRHQPRNIPLGIIPKDKWDSQSVRFRVIGDVSAGGRSSVNELIFDPRFLDFNLQGRFVRDALFALGPRAQIDTIDLKDAFRNDQLSIEDLHLFVYILSSKECYVDLRAMFGSLHSEYGFRAITSVLRYGMSQPHMGVVSGASLLSNYADNWVLMSEELDASHPIRWLKLKALFAELGVLLHEEQHGPRLKLLGWVWDTSDMSFSCPDDKLAVIIPLVSSWVVRASAGARFSCIEIRKVVGLLLWVSAACPVISPALGALTQARASAEKVGHVVLAPQAVNAVRLLDRFMTSWSGSSRLFLGFSPVSRWESLVRCDASTTDGCGGFVVPSLSSYLHLWSDSEREIASSGRLRESTPLLELWGLVRALEVFGPELRGQRVQFELDCRPAVLILRKCFSPNADCALAVLAVVDLCNDFQITPRWEHILAHYNDIADALSHNDFSQAQSLCAVQFGGPLVLRSSR